MRKKNEYLFDLTKIKENVKDGGETNEGGENLSKSLNEIRLLYNASPFSVSLSLN